MRTAPPSSQTRVFSGKQAPEERDLEIMIDTTQALRFSSTAKLSPGKQRPRQMDEVWNDDDDVNLFEFQQQALQNFERRIQILMEEDDDFIVCRRPKVDFEEDRDDADDDASSTFRIQDNTPDDEKTLNNDYGYFFPQQNIQGDALVGSWSAREINFTNYTFEGEDYQEAAKDLFLCGTDDVFTAQCDFFPFQPQSPVMPSKNKGVVLPMSPAPFLPPFNTSNHDEDPLINRSIETESDKASTVDETSIPQHVTLGSKTSSRTNVSPEILPASGIDASISSVSDSTATTKTSFSVVSSTNTVETPNYPPKLPIRGLEDPQSRQRLMGALSELAQQRWNREELAIVTLSTSSSTKPTIPSDQQPVSAKSDKRLQIPSSSRRSRFCKARDRIRGPSSASPRQHSAGHTGEFWSLKQNRGDSCVFSKILRSRQFERFVMYNGDVVAASLALCFLRIASHESARRRLGQNFPLVVYCSPFERRSIEFLQILLWIAREITGNIHESVQETLPEEMEFLYDENLGDMVHPIFKAFVWTGHVETNLSNFPYIFAHENPALIPFEEEDDGLHIEMKTLPWLEAELCRDLAEVTIEPFETTPARQGPPTFVAPKRIIPREDSGDFAEVDYVAPSSSRLGIKPRSMKLTIQHFLESPKVADSFESDQDSDILPIYHAPENTYVDFHFADEGPRMLERHCEENPRGSNEKLVEDTSRVETKSQKRVLGLGHFLSCHSAFCQQPTDVEEAVEAAQNQYMARPTSGDMLVEGEFSVEPSLNLTVIRSGEDNNTHPYDDHKTWSSVSEKKTQCPRKIRTLAEVELLDLSDLSDSSSEWSLEANLPFSPRGIEPMSQHETPGAIVAPEKLSANWSLDPDLPLSPVVIEPALRQNWSKETKPVNEEKPKQQEGCSDQVANLVERACDDMFTGNLALLNPEEHIVETMRAETMKINALKEKEALLVEREAVHFYVSVDSSSKEVDEIGHEIAILRTSTIPDVISGLTIADKTELAVMAPDNLLDSTTQSTGSASKETDEKSNDEENRPQLHNLLFSESESATKIGSNVSLHVDQKPNVTFELGQTDENIEVEVEEFFSRAEPAELELMKDLMNEHQGPFDWVLCPASHPQMDSMGESQHVDRSRPTAPIETPLFLIPATSPTSKSRMSLENVTTMSPTHREIEESLFLVPAASPERQPSPKVVHNEGTRDVVMLMSMDSSEESVETLQEIEQPGESENLVVWQSGEISTKAAEPYYLPLTAYLSPLDVLPEEADEDDSEDPSKEEDWAPSGPPSTTQPLTVIIPSFEDEEEDWATPSPPKHARRHLVLPNEQADWAPPLVTPRTMMRPLGDAPGKDWDMNLDIQAKDAWDLRVKVAPKSPNQGPLPRAPSMTNSGLPNVPSMIMTTSPSAKENILQTRMISPASSPSARLYSRSRTNLSTKKHTSFCFLDR